MTVHKVENLSKVDPTRYIEGDLFISKRSAAFLLNGKLEPIVTRSDVKKMIQSELKKVVKEDV
jgi:hypothetical protein